MTLGRQSQIVKTIALESCIQGKFACRGCLSRRIFIRALILLLLCGLGILAPLAARGVRAQTRAGGAGAAVVSSGSEATITFRKVFKSSYPEFVEIKVKQSGKGTYDIRQLDDDASPQAFEISASLAQKIFDLSGKLHDFQGVDLEVHRRLANLGEKTFRYEKGGDSHETTFNYTLDMTAAQLLSVFEGLSRQESDLSDLRRTMRYDRLGVNDVVLQIEADYDNKQLPEPEGFLDLLDQLAADQKFIDIARERARTLAGRIRSSH
jgi:hypothetical protein